MKRSVKTAVKNTSLDLRERGREKVSELTKVHAGDACSGGLIHVGGVSEDTDAQARLGDAVQAVGAFQREDVMK